MRDDVNKFEVIDYAARRVGELRFEEPTEWMPESTRDEDYVVRVIGRCVSGPGAGRRVQSLQIVSAEFYSDQRCKELTEQAAMRAWAKLPPADVVMPDWDRPQRVKQ